MSADLPKGNVKNPAIRRIHADIRELRVNPSDQYYAEPLEENLFEWHFTLRGPPSTDFAGGMYHGRILLPPEYPFKPPNIMLLTPNGRFEVGKKICLSISAHHPEHWQPAWGIRLILEALISFFPTDPKGAVGSLDWTPAERSRLAKESVKWSCPRCGPLAQILTSTCTTAEGGAAAEGEGGSQSSPSMYAKEIAQLYVHGASSSDAAAADGGAASPRPSEDGGAPASPRAAGNGDTASSSSSPPHVGPSSSSSTPAARRPLAPALQATTHTHTPVRPTAQQRQGRGRGREGEEEEDWLLYVAIFLSLLILALVVRKALYVAGLLPGTDEL